MTNAAELHGLIEAGDLYGLMLASIREWLAKYHPDAERGTVVVTVPGISGRDAPALQIPIIAPFDCAGQPAVIPAAS